MGSSREETGNATEAERRQAGEREDPGPGPARDRKTVAASRIEMSRLMRPEHANFSNNVHGGVMVGLMDEAAYLCATGYSESYCVTAAVDGVDFRAPVRVGDRVTLRAAVHAVGRTSMQVGISVEAQDPRNPGTRRSTNRSFFTMVALDGEGRPRSVPRLVCETAEDRRLQCEAELRKELAARFHRQLEEGMCRYEDEAA